MCRSRPSALGHGGRRGEDPLNLRFLAVHMADKRSSSVRSGGVRDGRAARGGWVGLLLNMCLILSLALTLCLFQLSESGEIKTK